MRIRMNNKVLTATLCGTAVVATLAGSMIYNSSRNVAVVMADDYIREVADEVSDVVVTSLSESATEKMIEKLVKERLGNEEISTMIKNTVSSGLTDSEADSLAMNIQERLIKMDLSDDMLFSDAQKEYIRSESYNIANNVLAGMTLTGSFSDSDYNTLANKVEKMIVQDMDISQLISEEGVVGGGTTNIQNIVESPEFANAVGQAIKETNTVTVSEVNNLKTEIIKSVQSSVKNGKDGKDGAQGAPGIQGVAGLNGEDGKDGKTPVKGVDYFTSSEITTIENAAAAKAGNTVASKIQSINNQITNNNSTLLTLQNQVTNLKTEVTNVSNKVSNMGSGSSGNTGGASDEDIKKLNNAVAAINGNIDTINANALSLKNSVAVKRQNLTIIGGDGNTSVVDTSNMAMSDFVDLLAGNDKQFTTTLAAYNTQLDEISETIGDTEALADDIETAKTQISNLTSAQRQLLADYEELDEKSTQFSTDIGSLKTKTNDLNTALANGDKQAVADAKQALITALANINVTDADLSSLGLTPEQLAAYQQAQQIIIGMEGDISQARADLDTNIEGLTDLEGKSEEQISEVLDALYASLTDGSLDSMNIDPATRAKLEEARNTVTGLKNGLEANRSSISNYGDVIDKALANVEKTDTAWRELDDAIKALQTWQSKKGAYDAAVSSGVQDDIDSTLADLNAAKTTLTRLLNGLSDPYATTIAVDIIGWKDGVDEDGSALLAALTAQKEQAAKDLQGFLTALKSALEDSQLTDAGVNAGDKDLERIKAALDGYRIEASTNPSDVNFASLYADMDTLSQKIERSVSGKMYDLQKDLLKALNDSDDRLSQELADNITRVDSDLTGISQTIETNDSARQQQEQELKKSIKGTESDILGALGLTSTDLGDEPTIIARIKAAVKAIDDEKTARENAIGTNDESTGANTVFGQIRAINALIGNPDDPGTGTVYRALANESSLRETLKGRVDRQDTAIAGLESDVESHGTDITVLQSTTTTQGSQISSLDETVDTHNTAIDGLNNTVTNQGTDISNLKNTTVTQGTNITNLQTTTGDQETAITELNNTVGSKTDSAGADTVFGIIRQEIVDRGTLAAAVGQSSDNSDEPTTLFGKLNKLTSTVGSSGDASTESTVFGILNKEIADRTSLGGTVTTQGTAIEGLKGQVGTADDGQSTSLFDRIKGIVGIIGVSGDSSSKSTVFGALKKESEDRALALSKEVTDRNNAIDTAKAGLQGNITALSGKVGKDGDEGQTTLFGRVFDIVKLVGNSGDADTASTVFGNLKKESKAREDLERTLNAKDNALTTRDNELSGQITANKTSIETVTSKANANENSISSLDTRVGTAENSITSVTNQSNTNKNSIDSLNTEVGNEKIAREKAILKLAETDQWAVDLTLPKADDSDNSDGITASNDGVNYTWVITGANLPDGNQLTFKAPSGNIPESDVYIAYASNTNPFCANYQVTDGTLVIQIPMADVSGDIHIDSIHVQNKYVPAE